MNYLEYDTTRYWTLSKYPAAFYKLFGIVLSYYGGGCNLQKGIVQQYAQYGYSENEFDWIVSQVENTVSNLLLDLGLDYDLRIERDPKCIKICSENVCSFLESVEYEEASDLFINLFKPTYGTYELACLQRLEFVCGTYIDSYTGKDSEWVFYNNFDKFQLVYKYMVELSDDDNIITSKTLFKTPYTHSIKLNIDGSLWKNIIEKLSKGYLGKDIL